MKTIEELTKEFPDKGELMSEKIYEAHELANDKDASLTLLLKKLIESHNALGDMIVAGNSILMILAQKKQM